MYQIGTLLARFRYHRYRSWSLMDFLICGCGVVIWIILRIILPKLFRNTDEKFLDKLAYAISIVFILLLVIVT